MSSVGGIRAGRAFIEIGASDSELQKVLRRAEKDLNATGRTIQNIGLKLVAGGGAVASSLLLAATSAGKLGSDLNDLSSKTGLSISALAALDLTAKSSGSSIDQLADAINRMQRTLTEAERGSKSAADALAEVGLTAEELRGLRPEDQFAAIASAVSVISDPSRQATVAMEIFGRSGANLLPILSQGAGGLRRFREQSEELGHTLAYEVSASVGEFGNAVTRVKQQISDLGNVIGASIASALQPYEKSVSGILKKTIDWAVANGQISKTIGEVAIQVTAVGAALVGVGAAIKGLAALTGFVTALAAPEVLVFFAALTALIVGLTKAIDKLVGGTQEIVDLDFKPVDLEGFKASEANRKRQIVQADALTSFANNPNKSQEEVSKAIEMLNQLEEAYGPLGISIDKTTGKVAGLDEGLGDLYARMVQVKKTEIKQAMDDVLERTSSIQEKLGGKDLAPDQRETLQKQLATLNAEYDKLQNEETRLALGIRDMGKEWVFDPKELPQQEKNESLLPETVADIEQAKERVIELRTQFREMSKDPFEVKTGMDEELDKIDEYAKKREEIAGEILEKEFVAYGPMGPDNVSPWENYNKRIEQIEKDRIAQVGDAEKRYADTINDYKLQLELELARARGDKQKEAEIRAEQFVRDQVEQIKSLGLTGQAKADAVSNVQEIADKMLNAGDVIRKQITGFSAGIVNSNAISSLNRAGRGNAPGVSELKKNVQQNEKIILLLQQIADSGGLVFQ